MVEHHKLIHIRQHQGSEISLLYAVHTSMFEHIFFSLITVRLNLLLFYRPYIQRKNLRFIFKKAKNIPIRRLLDHRKAFLQKFQVRHMAVSHTMYQVAHQVCIHY